MDIFAFLSLAAGLVLMGIGVAMEGITLDQLIQITAFLIVMGGSFGATMLCFPIEDVITAIKSLKIAFFSSPPKLAPLIKEMVTYAQTARKEGVIAFEKLAKTASDPLLALGLESVADGADPTLVRTMLETQLAQEEAKVEVGAKFWESWGAISPTIGIIGAVMGLIVVMQNLSDPSALGAGIAVAFVATIYGLIWANMFAIPVSTRIKFKYKKIVTSKELIIEGIISIQAGESPALIERKLSTYLMDGAQQPAPKKKEE